MSNMVLSKSIGNTVKRFALCILLCFAAVSAFSAQEEERGSNLTIKIAVMGPGDELYFWWGHIALIIDDARTGQSRFYDYGLFSFENENFFVNFAFGRLWYTCGVSPMEGNINTYINTNRSITLYTLDIPPEKREEVRQYAEKSILPANRDYLYHHFNHNCTNPIIQIIDLATDGQFRELYANEPGRYTLRQHVRRYTWFSPFFDWALNFLMGQGIDTPITVWDEMFLPAEIGNRISEFAYIDSEGIPQPLVSEIDVVYESHDRPAILDVPRKQWPRQLIFSLGLSLILGFLFFIQSRSTAFGQISLGIIHTLFGLVFGISGLILFFMSNFTEHDYTFHNVNLLFCNPLLLIAVPLGIRYAASSTYNKRLRAECTLRILWLLTALGIGVTMLIKLLPQFWQQNLTDQMLMLPIAVVLALEPAGLKRMLHRIFWRWL